MLVRDVGFSDNVDLQECQKLTEVSKQFYQESHEPVMRQDQGKWQRGGVERDSKK